MTKINREENNMSIIVGFKGRMGLTVVEMVKGDDELTWLPLLTHLRQKKKWTVALSSQIKGFCYFDADVRVISLCLLLPMEILVLLLRMVLHHCGYRLY